MAGVDKLHSQGIKGKGVKIGIIDTGVDYLHPSLGGGFGPGYKVSFGYDFVGDNYTGFNTPVPDNDPLASCATGGHGTHVTGIIGMTDASNQGFGLVGVAPEASIAMQQAAEDGVDLISMSLGSITYWEQASPYVPLAQSIVESGVAIIAALGNDGDLGPYAVSAPGLAPEVLAVGSAESEIYPTVYEAENNLGRTLEYISVLPFISDKPITIFEAGSGLNIPITEEQTGGKKYTLDFKSSMVQDSPNPAGHTIDYFSSIGPTIEMTLKPQLSSPGGTSMATPFTAGVYALIKSQKSELSIADITSLIQSTSVPMKAQNLNIISSVTQQGGGLINAYAAVAADSQISPSQLSLLDSPKPAKHSITIKNTSKKTKVYSISHLGASYIRTVTNFTGGSDASFLRFTLSHETKFAAAQFSKSKLSLQPESEPVYSGYVKIATDSSSYVVPYLGVPYTRNDVDYLGHNTTAWVGNDRPFVGPDVTKPGEINIGYYSILGRDGSVPANLLVPITGFIVVQPTNLVRLDAVPVNTSFVPTFYGFDPSVKSDVADVDLPLLEGFLGVPTYGILSAWGIGDIPPGIDPRTLVAWPNPNSLSGFILEWPLFMYENGTDFNITSGAFRPLLRILRYGNDGTNPDDYESWLGPIINAHTT
ncbi:minor extracellular protease vpr [Trichoderma asperellum]|uniref:Minor extracellular protease vpr n=1 Tax=Trichoderma asperellum TaxID=101201 RepID=A0A6V8QYF0_TRIAP|nr:minor extracellular protease vpr [Trichoderma asperellum]